MTAEMGNSAVRIGVVGVGPVGMILGSSLRKSGFITHLVDSDIIKMDLIRNEGVMIDGLFKEKIFFEHLHSSLEEMISHKPNLMFLALKAPNLSGVVQRIVSAGGAKIPMVCAMNGIDVEQMITEQTGEAGVMRMVVNFAGNLSAPNISRLTFFNPPNYIASVDDSCVELAGSVAAWLTDTGLKTELVNSFGILHRVWEKTILNASLSPICAVGRMTIKEAMELPDTVEVIEQVIEEAVEVAEAEKIRFPDDFIRNCLRYLRHAGDHFPSLAVDLLNSRPTEIDYMNGKIVEYGRKHYVRTSLNLAFTNMVKAITYKNSVQSVRDITKVALKEISDKTGSVQSMNGKDQAICFLGVDLGSAYTKFTVLNDKMRVLFRTSIRTHNRDRVSIKHVLNGIRAEFNVVASCATGYGRKHFSDADIIKTEINCAAKAVATFRPGDYNVVDIGGEDIKVIRIAPNGSIVNFYLNDKCAAGTGSFIMEIAEKAGIPVAEMSNLAAKSAFEKELNSFCTVFAKTEIMSWLFDGLSLEDISRGIYYSIINRVAKLRIDPTVPVIMLGGVISVHPYLSKMLTAKLGHVTQIMDHPQHAVSLGAALYARDAYFAKCNNSDNEQKELVSKV